MRAALEGLDRTLQETRATMEEIGKLAVRTDGDLRAFKYGLQLIAAVSGIVLTLLIGGAGYYFNQRDIRIEQIATMALRNLDWNREQADTDRELRAALLEAVKAIRHNQELNDRRQDGATR